MTEEDPFFVVRDEVQNALVKARKLYDRWNEFQAESASAPKDELEWTTTELRNSLRSIEWDLEDLEETVSIVEANPKKFKFGDTEIAARRQFITDTKEEVQTMRDAVAEAAKGLSSSKRNTVASLMNSGLGTVTGNQQPRYSKLSSSNFDSPVHSAGHDGPDDIPEADIGQRQSLMLRDSEENYTGIESSLQALKGMASDFGQRANDHTVTVDEVDDNIEVTTSRADFAFKKFARTIGLQTNKRQWIALGVFSFVLLAIVLFIAH